VGCVVKAFTTFFCKVSGAEDDTKVVQKHVQVQNVGQPRHHFIFNCLKNVSTVFETESFVLVMDQCFPKPNWEENLLPPHYAVVMGVLFEFMFDLFSIFTFFF
jgi:hypothetical protein